ncbi:membrane protein [Clostridia bacterium]|nr:membrane protein [Clostridia bacterium]GHV11544.1 membrane protein [Clostridia bacterium]
MRKTTLFIGLVLALVTLFSACSGDTNGSDKTKPIVDADVVITKNTISTKAQFIPVEVDGTKLEIIAVTAPDGTIRTAFNTCQVCYDSGKGFYKQDGDVLVCQNCGNRFKMSQVEVESGGCNPVPLWDDWTTETDDTITVPLTLLQEATAIFGNWKTEY